MEVSRGWRLLSFWSYLSGCLHSYECGCIFTHLWSSSITPDGAAAAASASGVLQRFRLDVRPVAAGHPLLIGQSRAAVAAGRLLQAARLQQVHAGVLLQGGRWGRPGHACARRRRLGTANQSGPLGRQPSSQERKPAGENHGDLRGDRQVEDCWAKAGRSCWGGRLLLYQGGGGEVGPAEATGSG